jgi:hypothetical protein
MTLNFVMPVPNVSSAFSVNVRVSGPYSRSGNKSNVRGDEPEVALRRYKESEIVLLVLRSLVTGIEILPHSIGPHGSHTISFVVTSSARAGEVGILVIPKMRAAPTQMARSGRANVTSQF